MVLEKNTNFYTGSVGRLLCERLRENVDKNQLLIQ